MCSITRSTRSSTRRGEGILGVTPQQRGLHGVEGEQLVLLELASTEPGGRAQAFGDPPRPSLGARRFCHGPVVVHRAGADDGGVAGTGPPLALRTAESSVAAEGVDQQPVGGAAAAVRTVARAFLEGPGPHA